MFGDYLDIRKSFVFYGSYHTEWRNQLLHLLGVPCIFTTALSFAHQYGTVGSVAGYDFSVAHLAAAFYALTFTKMERNAGLMYAPFIALMTYVAINFLQEENTRLAIVIHIVAWLSQLVGHGLFEKRKPALMDNLVQSLHASVFFVWLELLFTLGYNPKLAKELDAIVQVEKAKFA